MSNLNAETHPIGDSLIPALKHLACATPHWLKSLTTEDIKGGPGPWMKHLVEDALVYPGAGLDGSPVRQCNGVIHSFIFLDYGTPKEDVLCELKRQRKTGVGFAHHRLLDLVEFDPAPLVAQAAPEFIREGLNHHQSSPSYGIWAVFESTEPGPRQRFSFLFMSTEAIQALSSLFHAKAPKALVIQEHGFGGNCWRSFSDEVYKMASHWNGTPELLILGPNHQLHPWRLMGESLGTDVATESMHRNERLVIRLDKRTQRTWLRELQQHA
jgi:hypothetical protein